MKFIIEQGEQMQGLFKRHIELKLPSGKTYEIPEQIILDLEDLECKSVTESPLFLANKGDSIAWLDFWELAYPVDAVAMNPFVYEDEGSEYDGEIKEEWEWWLSEDQIKIIDKIIRKDSIIFKVDFVERMHIIFQIDTMQLPVNTLIRLKEEKLELSKVFEWEAESWDLQRMITPRKGEYIAIDILKQLCGDGDMYLSGEKSCEKILGIIREDVNMATVKDIVYQGAYSNDIVFILDIDK